MLVEGDLVSIDCGAIVDGWHGDAAFSRRRRRPRRRRGPDDLALVDATEDSHVARHRRARASGAPLFDVGAAVEDAIVAAGEAGGVDYGIVEDYVGHGIGTEMHQDPQVPELPRARPRARRCGPGCAWRSSRC